MPSRREIPFQNSNVSAGWDSPACFFERAPATKNSAAVFATSLFCLICLAFVPNGASERISDFRTLVRRSDVSTIAVSSAPEPSSCHSYVSETHSLYLGQPTCLFQRVSINHCLSPMLTVHACLAFSIATCIQIRLPVRARIVTRETDAPQLVPNRATFKRGPTLTFFKNSGSQ
jgi:hypothetical protein